MDETTVGHDLIHSTSERVAHCISLQFWGIQQIPVPENQWQRNIRVHDAEVPME